jgi:hypothetical protein
MEVSGQFEAPVALLPGNGPPVPIGQKSGEPQKHIWTPQIRENSLPLVGSGIQTAQFVAHCYADWAIPKIKRCRNSETRKTYKITGVLDFVHRPVF